MADSQAITSHQNGNGHTEIKRGDVVTHKDTTENLPAEMEIQRTRERISETTTQIQQQLKATMDWQGWVYRYPLQTLGIAAAAGIVTGFALGGSSEPKRRPSNGRGANPSKKEEELIKQTGQNTIVATILTNVATTALREGSQYLVRRFFSDEPNRQGR